MKWKIISLLVEAPLIPEPVIKDIGIPRDCLQFYRRNSSNKLWESGWWEEAGLGAGVCFLMTEAEYAFLWFSFMFFHKAFFMLSHYFVAAFFFLIYLGCQIEKESLPPCTLFSWKTSFNYSMKENEPAMCHRSQVTKGSLQSLSISRPWHSVTR